jgi:MFS family permease
MGYTAIQSGLLIMPQAAAAMTSKFMLPRILTRVGYRAVLIANTMALGALLVAFATVGPHTPIWLIVLQAFAYGALSSLQYTSMNTLVYADISDAQSSSASSIASTMQQMSISFGVAAAGLTTALFVPDRFKTNPSEMVHGIHLAFIVLGLFTMASTIVFHTLKASDGGAVSQHKVIQAG